MLMLILVLDLLKRLWVVPVSDNTSYWKQHESWKKVYDQNHTEENSPSICQSLHNYEGSNIAEPIA